MGIPAPMGVGAAGLPNAGDQANAVLSGVISAVGPTAPFAIRGPMNLVIWAATKSALTITSGSLTASVASATGINPGAAINSTKVPNGTTVGAIYSTTVTLAPPQQTFYAYDLSTSNVNVTLPAGSNVAGLVGATVTVPSNAEGITIPGSTTVASVVQADVAPSGNSPGVPGIIALSAAPTAVPAVKGRQPLQFAVGAAAITAASGADANATFVDAATKYDATVQLERSFDGGKTWLVCNIGAAGALAQFIDLSVYQVTFGEPEKNVLYRLNCIEITGSDTISINYRLSTTGEAATSLSVGTVI